MSEIIYDAHVYVGSDYHTYFHQIGEYSIEKYEKVMQSCGIAKAALIAGGYGDEVATFDQQIVKGIKQDPAKFVGLKRALPRDPNVLREIERAIKVDGMKGIMLHPQWDTYVANSRMLEPIFDLIRYWGIPVLMYSGDIPYTMPGQIADMAEKYPEVPIIMGHMGKIEIYQHSVFSALRSPNIYLETSGCNVSGIIEDAVKKLGAERVLFGSGWPGMSPHAEIAKIRRLKLTDDQKERIMHRNFQELLMRDITGVVQSEMTDSKKG